MKLFLSHLSNKNAHLNHNSPNSFCFPFTMINRFESDLEVFSNNPINLSWSPFAVALDREVTT